jgi:monovalent cation:H+ antiporter-2, CPA2 family
MDLIRTDYPLAFETQDFMLPFEEGPLNCSIRELDLRSKTGASIVGIYRAEETLPNPSPDVKLLPGDVLLLIGNKEQIKVAMQYLQDKIRNAA